MSIALAEWNSARNEMEFNLGANGFDIKGRLYLTDKNVRLEARLPFMARVFSNEIEKRLREELESRLS